MCDQLPLESFTIFFFFFFFFHAGQKGAGREKSSASEAVLRLAEEWYDLEQKKKVEIGCPDMVSQYNQSQSLSKTNGWG